MNKHIKYIIILIFTLIILFFGFIIMALLTGGTGILIDVYNFDEISHNVTIDIYSYGDIVYHGTHYMSKNSDYSNNTIRIKESYSNQLKMIFKKQHNYSCTIKVDSNKPKHQDNLKFYSMCNIAVSIRNSTPEIGLACF